MITDKFENQPLPKSVGKGSLPIMIIDGKVVDRAEDLFSGFHADSEDFEESEHPREKDGKFAPKDGGSSEKPDSEKGGVTRSKAQNDSINRIAKKTRNLKKEQYRIVDADGNVVLEKKGDAHSVAATVGEKRDFLKGAASIHNHPVGGTFSADDLSDFGYGATEMFATSPEGVYSLTNDKYGTKEQYNGWLDMKERMMEEVPQEMSFTYLQKTAQENLKNSEEARKMKEITDEWVRMKDSGASRDELNKFYDESGYVALSERQKENLSKERRRLEVEPQHKWLEKNAEKYGFTYRFKPWDRKDGDDMKEPSSVGVVVVKDGKILCGRRFNTSHYGEICGPGGHIDPGESSEDAARRETEEEFGIIPRKLEYAGAGKVEPDGTYPDIYLCTDFAGEPMCDDTEMTNPKFVDVGYLKDRKDQLFKPFLDGLATLTAYLKAKKVNADVDNGEEKGYNDDVVQRYRERRQARLDTKKLHPAQIKKAEKAAKKASKGGSPEFNEADHPRDKDGKFITSGGSSEGSESAESKKTEAEKKESEEKKEPKPKKERKAYSFSTRALDEHFDLHGDEPPFEGLTHEQYQDVAQYLLNKDIGDGVDGYDFEDDGGKGIVRYDREEKIFAKGYNDGRIKTCFVPKYWVNSRDKSLGFYPDWERRADDYFERYKKEEELR